MAIEDRVKQVIVDQLGIEERKVVPKASIMKDLRADHDDYMKLLDAFEEEFKIEIPNEDAEKLHTVKDVIAYIKSKVPAKQPA